MKAVYGAATDRGGLACWVWNPDASLWFLATGGGELVEVNLAQSGPLGGYVAQLAVRRGQRGRGLGLALLRHGVR